MTDSASSPVSSSSEHCMQEKQRGFDTVSLRRHHNAQSPSHKLPVETLRQIFQLLVPPVIFPTILRDLDRFMVTWVCYYWRVVALGSPELWSLINFGHTKRLVKAMLTRSRDTPLTIYFIEYKNMRRLDRNTLLEILTQTHRLQQIFIYICSPDRKLLDPLCTSNAPQLHTLALHGKFSHITVPDNLFTQLPYLRDLHLTSCRVNWATFINRDNRELKSLTLRGFNPSISALKNLTTLCVSRIGWLRRIEGILECLEQLHHLRILELHDAVFWNVDNVNATHHQPVDMPELLRVSLSENLKFTNILDIIHTPKLLSVSFKQDTADGSPVDCSSLYSLCSRLSNRSIPCRQVKVGLGGDDLYIEAWRDDHSDPDDLLDQPLIKIEMEIGSSVVTSYQDIMKEFLRRLSPSFSGVQHLTVLVKQFTDIDWIEIFGSLDQVESIRTDSFEGLAKMLCLTRNIHTQPTSYFPMLRNLVLDISQCRQERDPMVVGSESVDMFIQYCEMASARGEGTKQVVLKSCEISGDDVRRLETHAKVSRLEERWAKLPFGLYSSKGWFD